MSLPFPLHPRTSSLHPPNCSKALPMTPGMAGPLPKGIADASDRGAVNLASPVASASSWEVPRTMSLKTSLEGSVFGSSLQRSRKVQNDYFSRTPPLSSPTTSSDTHTPASDLPLTPRTASTSGEVSTVHDWPMPPSRRGLGFDILDGSGDVYPVSRAETPYYLAPEWSNDYEDGYFATPGLGMSLQSQSLVNLSRPTNLEQLQHLRQAAFELESVAFGKREVHESTHFDRRIRRKAVPAIPDGAEKRDEAPLAVHKEASLAQHRLSVAHIPQPVEPVITVREPKRPTLASIYRNSRASQSVSELSNRISTLSVRGPSLFGSKNVKPISAPIPIESETRSLSEHSDVSQASTSSSFSATYPKDPEIKAPYITSEDQAHRASTTESESSSTEPAPTTPPVVHLSLPEVDSNFKKLGVGFHKGMTSVLNLLHSDGEPKERRKLTSLSFFRKASPSPRRSFSLPKMFKKTPVASF